MRSTLAITILILGLSSAAPEPEYASPAGSFYHPTGGKMLPPLVEIETSTHRADRLTVAALSAVEPSEQGPDLGAAEIQESPVPVSTDIDTGQTLVSSIENLCNALFTSAQDNDLPVPFFANLIWQESRLRDDAVSRVGALGIAQFMPERAEESGLQDPFDPMQAIPASARLLRALRAQFGNLGFVAAAYNAGPHRVSEWLERGRALPHETLNYVLRVTGRSAQDWRATPPDDGALAFVRHLPCLSLPAFADIEQTQLEEAQEDEVKLERPDSDATAKPEQPASTTRSVHRRAAEREHPHPHGRRETGRTAARGRAGHPQTAHNQHAPHAGHRRA